MLGAYVIDWLTHLHGSALTLIVGVAIAATCSLLSIYVVLRRMALIAEGVSHAGFGGIAVALLAGYYMPAVAGDLGSRLITGAFCLATALLIGYFTRSGRVHEDSAIGIFLVASVAFGNLLLHYHANLPHAVVMSSSIENLLFGDFAAVTLQDALLSVATAIVCFGVVGALYWQFLYATLDEEMARVNGVNTRLINLLLLAMISTVIVIGVPHGRLSHDHRHDHHPGATANMVSRKFSGVLAASLGVGVGGTLAALLLASNTRLVEYPAGPVLVLTLFAIFVVVWKLRQVVKPKAALGTQNTHADHEH